MKNNLYKAGVLAAVGVCVAVTQSCNTDLPSFTSYEAYTYASKDENGGNWTPVILASGADVPIPAPSDIASPEYATELAEVKNLSSNVSADQQEAIDYWGNNTIIRWMEIAQELSSKYNLAPSPNEDGTYSAPNSANPGVYPYFPFAHPPYATRVYAYLAAASYDAMIATWHYKYQYNRMAPFANDASVEAAYPDNGIPSYPSEDAALSMAAEKILNFMFPLEVEYITSKAEECRNSRKWAGMNVESDLVMGDSIGSYVATQFLNRAKTDSMKFAQVDKPTYEAMEAANDALFADQWPHWENLEVPQRPVGITPKYGHVALWWVPNVEAVRPGPPPAFGSAEYKEAEAEMLDYTENATTEEKELAYFWGDGLGTYTPAGHWNKIATDYIISYQQNPLRTARTFAYLNTAMADAGVSCWDTKYYYMYPRPPQGNPDIHPIFGLPNFPSYTSGHSTFSGAAANVLGYIFPADAGVFDQFAKDASESRIIARIHWRFDAETGLEVGYNIGDYVITAAQADGADD